MLASFVGGNKIANAFEAGLSQPDVDLIVVREALGAATINAVRDAAALEDPDHRTSQLQELLYNAIPLADAEQHITEWAHTTLPKELKIYPSLESPVVERKGMTPTHFDTATAISDLIHGPFAISIGTVGKGVFQGLRLPNPLTDEQLLGTEPAEILEYFEDQHTTRGFFNVGVKRAQVEQRPGDIILIPGAPHPTLHSVEVPRGQERASVISSYVITPNLTATAAELRQQKIAEREFELRFLTDALLLANALRLLSH